MTDYTPGVCNIDTSGQKKRMIFGVVGILLGLAVVTLIAIFNLSIWLLTISLILFWMGMLGLVQSKAKFCVANAANSQYEVEGKMTSIEDAQSQALDRKRALVLHIQAISIALILTAIVALILIFLR